MVKRMAYKPYYPPLFLVLVELRNVTLAQAIRVATDTLQQVEHPLRRWTTPSGKTGGLQDLDAFLKSEALSDIVDFEFADRSTAGVVKQGDSISFYLDLPPQEQTESAVIRSLQQAVDACASLLAQQIVQSGTVIREGGGAYCLPVVPIAADRTHAVMTNNAQVADAYDEPASFWKAGWESAAQHGGYHLLTRALTQVDGVAFLSEVIDDQWSMARAAKPVRTKYYSPDPNEAETPIFRAGEATILPVGYLPSVKRAEFSCYLERQQHVRGWEVFRLYDFVRNGELPDRKAVEVVRVTFADQDSAEREKRPLLDIGVEVFYMDAEGEYVEITD